MGVVATFLFCLSAYKRHVSLISSFLVKNKTWMHGWVLYIVSMLHFGYFCNVCTQHQHLIKKSLKCYSRDHWWPLTIMCMYARLFLCSTLKKIFILFALFCRWGVKREDPWPSKRGADSLQMATRMCALTIWQPAGEMVSPSARSFTDSDLISCKSTAFLKCRRKSCNFYQVEKQTSHQFVFFKNSSQSSLFVGLTTSTVVEKKLRAIKMIIWQASFMTSRLNTWEKTLHFCQ